MGHCVQLIIGKGLGVEALLRAWPQARAVEMRGGWMAVPATVELLGEMAGVAGGLESVLVEVTRGGGSLAYVETEYFGGTGDQSAMVFANGREVMDIERTRGPGAINAALKKIGVLREAGQDEFDTVGLGERRSMEDYEPGAARHMRFGRASEPKPAPKSGLPLWLVTIVICAAVAGGVWAAMSN